MPKTKKHAKHRAAHRQHFSWLNFGGYIGLKHVALFAASIGALGIAFAAGFWLKPAPPVVSTPLVSLSHGSDAPSTVELIKLINTARISNHQMALTTDARLQLTAEARLQDMIGHQYYSHQDLNGKYYYDLLKEQGLNVYSCENLGIESTTDAQLYIDSWLTSKEGHRECLLSDKVTAVGIASGLFSPVGGGQTEPTYLVVTIYADPPLVE